MRPFLHFLAENVRMTPVSGTQYGSNPGGIHHDEHGQKHYVKYYHNPDQGRVEALTGELYHQMGVHTVRPRSQIVNGKQAVVAPWNDHLKRVSPSHFENLDGPRQHQIGRMYHAAVLTKNWDIVGLEHDNIVRHGGTGDLYAVDHGGAFHFRAMGGAKEYGPDIDDHQTLRHGRSPSVSTPPAAHVFGSVFKQNPSAEHEGLKAVQNLHDDKVHETFKSSGLHNWEQLHTNFVERKRKLLAHYSITG